MQSCPLTLSHDTLCPQPLTQLLVNDNLDLGCTIIERAATDKAVRDIDKSLAAQYEARANARRNGLDFYKHSMMQQQQSGPFPAGLPESLMPKPGNLAQQRVYEDFGRLPRGQPLAARYGEGGVPPGSPLQVGLRWLLLVVVVVVVVMAVMMHMQAPFVNPLPQAPLVSDALCSSSPTPAVYPPPL